MRSKVQKISFPFNDTNHKLNKTYLAHEDA